VVMDHMAHARSDVLPMLIPNINLLVDDAAAIVRATQKRVATLRGGVEPVSMLFAESMGGNIALRLLLKTDMQWRGAVLVAPMIKIDDKIKPPSWQIPLLRLASNAFPNAAVIPNKVSDEGFKYKKDGERFDANPLTAPAMSVRLATADAVMRACEELEPQLSKIATPFVVCHGLDDRVIPIAISELLVSKASSTDKQILKYEHATHCVDAEEATIKQKIFNDVGDWLVAHADNVGKSTSTSTSTLIASLPSTPTAAPAAM